MKKKNRQVLRGVCFLHSETGTEGGYWAFQDKRFMTPPSKKFPSGQWSYKGLHILEDGDRLTIYDKQNRRKVLWRGVIRLNQHPLFTESAFSFWIHADQVGVERDILARWFLEDYPATLVPAKNKPVR